MRTVLQLLPALLLPAIAAGANRYVLDVRSDQRLNVRGTARLTWRNETPGPVAEIPLQCSGAIRRASAGARALRVRGQRILLPEPVAAGAAVTVDIQFETRADSAYGYRMLKGSWHPKAMTYWNGRYNPNQPQCDDYEVTLAAPAWLTVVSAGEPVAGPHRYRWRLSHSTSFGLAASPEFVETLRTSAGVGIRFYRLHGDSRLDPAMADYAADAVAFYQRLFGFYPHPAVVMLPGDRRWGGGYSPASGFTVFHRNSGDGKRWIVAHEIAHQYWGFDTVLDDGDYFHWPGLALGIYTDQLYMMERGTRRYGVGEYVEVLAKGLDTTIRRTLLQMKTNRFNWGSIVAHDKAYVVVRMLADMMGPDCFLQFLRALTRQFRYRILSFDDFQAAAENAAGRKLDWFFHDWVNTNGVAGYAVERVQARGGQVEIQVRRTGTARFPVEVRLTTSDGAQTVQRIASEPELQTLVFAAAGEPRSVEIDPRGICPLLKTGRESWTKP